MSKTYNRYYQCPKLGSRKRTRQNNPKPATDKPKENEENIPEKRNRASWGTEAAKENETGEEGETDGNTESNGERDGETDTQEGGNNVSAEKKDLPKNFSGRKDNQCWCSLVYDSIQDVQHHIKLDHVMLCSDILVKIFVDISCIVCGLFLL